MSLTGWSAGALPPTSAPAPRALGTAGAFAASAGTAVDELVRAEDFDTFTVARMTETTWTGLASRSLSRPSIVGRPVPLDQTACHHLLLGRGPVLAPDLREHPDPELRAVSVRHGVAGYVGAPLRRPDGRLLGSVCGYTADGWSGDEPGRLTGRLAAAADVLGRQLTTALDALDDERRASFDRALGSLDHVTGLPDRRGWGVLLQDEADRARLLAEDLSVVLVDVGLVRSVRGVRRAGHVLREALGDVSVSRVGGRQFGVVGGDLAQLDPAATAALAQDALRAAGYPATTGWAVREPLESVVSTWWRAEDALVRVRSGTAAG